MSKDKTRWDVYVWVGSGDIKLHESNLSLKDAKKSKEKWVSKSPRHEAFIASHGDKKILKGLLGEEKPKAKTKPKAKAADKAKSKDKAKAKDKSKAQAKDKAKQKSKSKK